MALDIIARGMAADSIKCISQDLTEEQKAIARNNIGASGGSGDLKNAVQVIPQNFTEDQKTQARTNIGALSRADLSVWSQRTDTEEDLNILANVENGKAYISRYDTSTANTPVTNTQGNVISFRNSSGQLTQIAMEVQSGKIYYRASATSADFGIWKEIGGAQIAIYAAQSAEAEKAIGYSRGGEIDIELKKIKMRLAALEGGN